MKKIFEVANNFKLKLAQNNDDYESDFFGEPLDGSPKDERPERTTLYRRMEETPDGPVAATKLSDDEINLLIQILMKFRYSLPYASNMKHKERFNVLKKKLVDML